MYLALHLERENVWNKDFETIEKLFSETEEGFIPHNVIGIQYLESAERIGMLNDLIIQKNRIQNSNALMIYRFYDSVNDVEGVHAYYFTPLGLGESRIAISKIDDSGYWYSCFEEEYASFQAEKSLIANDSIE